MQIQVNTDNHTQGSAELSLQVESVLETALARYGDRVTRVEVQLNDENSSHKTSGNDKRCVLEARLAGLQPITVSDHGASIEQALSGAASKLQKALDRVLGKRDNPKGRTSFAGDQSL